MNNVRNMCKNISESINFKCAALPMKLSIFLFKKNIIKNLEIKNQLFIDIKININPMNFA